MLNKGKCQWHNFATSRTAFACSHLLYQLNNKAEEIVLLSLCEQKHGATAPAAAKVWMKLAIRIGPLSKQKYNIMRQYSHNGRHVQIDSVWTSTATTTNTNRVLTSTPACLHLVSSNRKPQKLIKYIFKNNLRVCAVGKMQFGFTQILAMCVSLSACDMSF